MQVLGDECRTFCSPRSFKQKKVLHFLPSGLKRTEPTTDAEAVKLKAS